MTVEVTVGPPVLTINRSSTFMVTDFLGEIDPHRAQGVFASDTRFVSSYHLFFNGVQWQRLSSTTLSYHSAKLFMVNPEYHEVYGPPPLAAGAIQLMLTRSVDDGIHEFFKITNYAQRRVRLVLEVEIESDFADLFEVKAASVRQRDNVNSIWDDKNNQLSTTYRHQDYFRRLVYKLVDIDQPPSFANGHLFFVIELDHNKSWQAHGQMLFEGSGMPESTPPQKEGQNAQASDSNRLHRQWISTCTALTATDAELSGIYTQSLNDMGALRLLEKDLRPDIWVPAAGVPWYVTLFGRDSLLTSLENMMIQPRFAEGALRTLAKYQADKRDDWRDAQPGKIMHEIRYGELAYFNTVPQTPYYGTWDATSLYLMAMHQAWLWLADRKLMEELLPTAERCLDWIDEYGDLDADGFQEYKTFSSRGFEDMSWKDSGHGIVYEDGKEIKQPKATCELQGYVYAAKLGMAEVFAAFGDHTRAKKLEEQAEALKRRFNEAFWIEEEGIYAIALDPDKRPSKAIASNAGHCLWTGIADGDKAERVVRRLLDNDMWCGWGVRTLSAKNPAYNPNSYQRGSVWPHDNAIIAAGMKRYGFGVEANQVARGILDAAVCFQSQRLPEVFAGLEREGDSFPVQYRGANTPQAWAAGSIFLLAQTMLGIRADAPRGKLYVNPTLPDWLPSLELAGLRVGETRLALHFWREEGESKFAVVSQDGAPVDVELEKKSASGPGGARP